MNLLEITSHKLAAKLLAGPDLPVYRHDESEDGSGLKPLSHVGTMSAYADGGDVAREVIVIDAEVLK